MYFRPISDIHLEFRFVNKGKRYSNLILPVFSTDEETVLIIAGDMEVKTKRQVEFLQEMSQRFFAVIYVLGNHDYWNNRVELQHLKVKQHIEECGLTNVYVLQNDYVILNDIIFFGATLWTDFDRENPLAMTYAQLEMRDFKKIRTGNTYRRIRPVELLHEHKISRKKIFETAQEFKDKKIIVITHHAPSEQSVDPNFGYDIFTPCYVSSLDYEILDNTNIKFWIHGHIHQSFNYMIGETTVICNPRGYSGHEINNYFDPSLRLEI